MKNNNFSVSVHAVPVNMPSRMSIDEEGRVELSLDLTDALDDLLAAQGRLDDVLAAIDLNGSLGPDDAADDDWYGPLPEEGPLVITFEQALALVSGR